MELFNNREIAILIWSAILLAWTLSKKDIRSSLVHVIRTAFVRPLVTIYGVMALYVLLIVYLIHALGLWDASQLKPTIIWTFSIALISAFRANKIIDDPDYFKRAVRDNINLVVILEFILGFYTLPLVAELILVPVTTILMAVKIFAERKEEHHQVEKLLDGLFVIFGLIVLAYAGHKLWIGFDVFATMQTLQNFYTPPLLSLLFLPFLFGLSVFMAYERVFVKLKRNSSDEATYRFFRRQAILGFLFRVRQLERWSNETFRKRLTSNENVKESIAEFKEIVAYEANPKDVPPDQGWFPQIAKNFMADYRMKTGYYDKLYDDEWFASSSYLELGDSILPNTIGYYLSGDQFTVKSLKLKLNLNEPDQEEEALRQFIGLSELLLEKALCAGVSTNFDELMRTGKDAETEVAGRVVSIKREDWHAGKTGQYEICFEVCMPHDEEEISDSSEEIQES